MLDNRSKYVLTYLIKNCSDGSYKIIEIADILSAIPNKYNADKNCVIQALKHLSALEYISVKYSDDKVYCVSPLPMGRQYYESEEQFIQKSKKYKIIAKWAYIILFATAFFGAFLGTLFYSIIF